MTKNQRITKTISRLPNAGIFAYTAQCAWHLNEETQFVAMMRKVVQDVRMEEAVKYCLSEEILKELRDE